ncbi:beta-lactamase domain-containing protein [Caballeronia catudaia]|uniref:Beta-lactamase domain-containing protein n=1 Tax=Caballeronia catudaia TaxID=1777136 RepID=A0A158A013_9BURK|nr:MBL fold metallo-hydrolase [Caballeronia catudaia]SAK51131.1 beta-lactamase domain-containing protein [Caballeronia catudaia]
MSRLRYLKPSVQMEPLVARWYAWPHLISPAPCALNIVRRHVPIMESYVLEPAVHADAVSDPNLLGGPFLDYDGARTDEVHELLETTRIRCARQIELASAIEALNALLDRHGGGGSLEPLYARVSGALKGLVELVYDGHHRASVRYLEALMYRAECYDESLQSLAFSPTDHDARKFVLSTPRLDDSRTLFAQAPFRSKLIDKLFSMRTAAADVDEVLSLFGDTGSADAIIGKLFTDHAPRRAARHSGKSVRVRYFGHACVLIETESLSVLVDPVVSYDYPSALLRYTYLDLPEFIDYVLITHNHQDHVMLETLLQLRHRVGTILVPNTSPGTLQDPSLSLMLRTIGFADVRSVDMLEELTLQGGSILPLPFLGEHSDLRIDSKTAYLVTLNGKKILLGADSRNIEPMIYQRLAPLVGAVDALFIGMECDGAPLSWLYGPLMALPLERAKDEERTLSGSDAAMVSRMIHFLRPGRLYVYAMGQEPWLNHVMSIRYSPHSPPIVESGKLIEQCRANGIPAERLYGSAEFFLS